MIRQCAFAQLDNAERNTRDDTLIEAGRGALIYLSFAVSDDLDVLLCVEANETINTWTYLKLDARLLRANSRLQPSGKPSSVHSPQPSEMASAIDWPTSMPSDDV